MTKPRRDILAIVMILLMAVLSFAAGFLVNEVLGATFSLNASPQDHQDFGLFWEAWGKIESSYLGELPTGKEMTYGAVKGAIEVIGDPYTIFVEPAARAEERERLRGNFGGIGVYLTEDESGRFVLTLITGNPAEEAGVQNGATLVAVDGQDVRKDFTIDEIADLIRGEVGTDVILTVIQPDNLEEVEIVVKRATILLPSVAYRILEEDPTIGYIQLSRFSAESRGEVENALLDLKQQGAEKIILDLRQNLGGLLDAAVDVADLFLDGGVVLYQVSKEEDEQVFNASNEVAAGNSPLVVLVDGGTASSAEIVAGALRDRERAILIGTTTYGKGSVQLVYDLSDGSSIHVTSARWYTPNRHLLDQNGLAPDFVVEPTQAAIDQGLDEVLLMAVEHLKG